MDNVSFLIPVRGGSTRIPRKNMLELEGETLIARKIRQVSPLGKVYVGSDDGEMLQEAQKHGAIALQRKKTNEGADSANDMIKEFLGLIEPCSTVVWCHVTNPLITTETYNRALVEFEQSKNEGYDSLVSVHEMHGHFWYSDMRNPYYNVTWCRNIRHLCANELPPLYEQDGGIFIQPYSRMLRNGYFFGEHPKLFKIPEEEFCDINTMRDWICCQALVRK